MEAVLSILFLLAVVIGLDAITYKGIDFKSIIHSIRKTSANKAYKKSHA
jgi:hypothetical protein